MSKSDSDFINTGKEQAYELEDWLKNNEFSSGADNFSALNEIILNKLKHGISTKNVKWDDLNAALKANPEWFGDLAKIEHKK